MERLDKVLAATGRWSRREVKQLVRQGQVRVNGAAATSAEEKVEPETAVITVGGEPVRLQKYTYVMLHKPAGVLTAARDSRAQTVMDLLPEALRRRKVLPVGRLDKDTTGLLLLTNDGELAHRLLSTKRHVWKRYLATVEGRLCPADALAFGAGMELSDFVAKPAELTILRADERESQALVSLREGKFHQVKRMFSARGHEVLALHRTDFGPLTLDGLECGAYRALTDAEVAALRRSANEQASAEAEEGMDDDA